MPEISKFIFPDGHTAIMTEEHSADGGSTNVYMDQDDPIWRSSLEAIASKANMSVSELLAAVNAGKTIRY